MPDETVTVVPYYDELRDPEVLAHLVAMIDWHRRRENSRGPRAEHWREWYADKILEEIAEIRDRLAVLRRSRAFGDAMADQRYEAPLGEAFSKITRALARGAAEHADRVATAFEDGLNGETPIPPALAARLDGRTVNQRRAALGLAPAPDPSLPNPMVAGERKEWREHVQPQGGNVTPTSFGFNPTPTAPRKGIMRLFRRKAPLLAVGIFAATLIGFTGTAHASVTQQTKTVSWVTSLAPGVTTPTGADGVTWPQTLLKGDPACGTVIQTDVYRYGTKTDRDIVDGLLDHGTLNKPGSAHWTDSAVVLSWKFTVEDACPTTSPTPTPSETPTPSVSPSPSSTPSETTPPPTASTPPVVVVLPSLTPTATPTVLPSVTPSPTVGPSATPPAKTCPTGQTLTAGTCQLPFTGFSVWPFVLAGAACLGIGGAFLLLTRRRTTV